MNCWDHDNSNAKILQFTFHLAVISCTVMWGGVPGSALGTSYSPAWASVWKIRFSVYWAASYRNANLIWFLTILLHKPADDIALLGVLCDPLVNIESSLWNIPASKVLSCSDETAVQKPFQQVCMAGSRT